MKTIYRVVVWDGPGIYCPLWNRLIGWVWCKEPNPFVGVELLSEEQARKIGRIA